ncbi:MAG TPA: FtsK/SpoIIIE domain-containing protein [Jiangellaceae bacterium]
MKVNGPRIGAETVKVSLGAWLAGWLFSLAGRLLLALARRPLVLASVVAVVMVANVVGDVGLGVTLAVLAVIAGLAVVWWRLHAASFRRLLAWKLRAWWRKVWVYRREWAEVMAGLSLIQRRKGADDLVPELVRVRCTATVDVLRVRLLPGQVLSDFATHANRLAQTFQALDCRVRSLPRRKGGASRVVELWFLIADPLTDTVAVFQPPAKPRLSALPVALGEDGLTWNLRLLATHWLIVGATGAGKGSVLWSIIRSLGHAVASRTVELWVIDPKGGMELAFGRRLFTRFSYGQPTDPDADTAQDRGKRRAYEVAYAELLEDAVRVMGQRQARLMGRTRTHKPAPGDPLIVIIIDELASLTAYVTDKDAKRRIETALNLLLSQGRAVGVVVIAALQDPRKEAVPARGLFPARIALRLSEASEVDLTLGEGTRDKGARCDEIPRDLPGVGFVHTDERSEPLRVRFSYVSDGDIADMCAAYAPGNVNTTATVLHQVERIGTPV